MRTAIAVGFSIVCLVAPVAAKTKADHSRCEERCREYFCSGGMTRQFYCDYQCHKKCFSEDLANDSDLHSDATLNEVVSGRE